jgi:hypothetical protein
MKKIGRVSIVGPITFRSNNRPKRKNGRFLWWENGRFYYPSAGIFCPALAKK